MPFSFGKNGIKLLAALTLPKSGNRLRVCFLLRDQRQAVPERGRMPLAAAMRWVSQITTIALQMALPPLGGAWLDSIYGTSPWLVCIGALLGFATGMLQLLKLAKTSSTRYNGQRDDHRERVSD